MRATTKLEQLISDLNDKIQAGLFAEGSQLPSMRVLATSHNCSTFTVIQAIHELEKRGLICTNSRSRCIVRSKSGASARRFALVTDVRQNSMDNYYDDFMSSAQEQDYIALPCLLGDDLSAVRQLLSTSPHKIAIDVEFQRSNYSELMEILSPYHPLFFNRYENDDETQPEDAVLSDYLGMTIETLKYLHSKGHKRIVFVGHKREPRLFKKRCLERAAAAVGLKFPSIEFNYCWMLDYEENKDRFKKVFLCKDRPTALIARSDALLFGLANNLKAYDNSYRTLECIGCHNSFWSRIPGQEFSTWQFDFHDMFTRAMNHSTPHLEYVMPMFIERGCLK